MSYDVCVWDPARHAPLPTNGDDALDIMERLIEVADSRNPAFEEFSRDLVQHCDAILQGKPRDLKTFWGGDPVQSATECKSAVYRLCLPKNAGMEQLAPIVAAAARHGLVVVNDEDGMCFLPDGTIYPEDMREIWKSDLAELLDPSLKKPDKRNLLQTLASDLLDVLGQGNKRIY